MKLKPDEQARNDREEGRPPFVFARSESDEAISVGCGGVAMTKAGHCPPKTIKQTT